MIMFVHLAPEKALASIRRSGLRPARHASNGRELGVFAMPVLPNFLITHQWLRELKRGGQRTFWAVYFRLPAARPVLVGHFGRPHHALPAHAACALIRAAADPLGYEVLIPGRIERSALHRLKPLPQTVGWRYRPDIREAPYCACPVCARPGTIKSRRKWERWQAAGTV